MKPLTKSQFKLGLQCILKLKYHRLGLPSSLAENDLLQLLAEGGSAVEALQRAIEPPYWAGTAGDATVAAESMDALRRAVAESARDGYCRSLYEVTISCGDFLARIDLLRVRRDRLELVEIKSKAWTGPQGGRPLADIEAKDGTSVLAPWVPYLQDLGFQVELLRRWLALHGPELGLPVDIPIEPKLVLAKAGGVATAADCLGNFRTRYTEYRGQRRAEVTFHGPPIRATDLIHEADAASGVALMARNAQSSADGFEGLGIGAAMDRMVEIVRSDTWPTPWASLRSLCRRCEYRVSHNGISGFACCWGGALDADWQHILQLAWGTDQQVRLALDRSDGSPLMATFTQLQLSELQPRQEMQWRSTPNMGFQVSGTLLGDRFGVLEAPATGPLYFLDFETARFPIPYRAGGTVNELVPFQFEGHMLPDRSASLRLRRLLPGFLDLASDDPRRSLVRAMREQFGTSGPIYHWSPFENQVLMKIAVSLREDVRPEPGDDELIAYCHSLRDRLVDLCGITRGHVHLPRTGGSYSIKRVLPVIWSDPEMRLAFAKGRASDDPNHYDDPIDPYHSLPKLSGPFMERVGPEVIEWISSDQGEADAITNGGLAMAYYHYVRLFGGHERPEVQRQFRQYCQLDSAAMLMAFDFLRRIDKLTETGSC